MTEFGRVITQNEHNLHNGNFQFTESAAQILRRDNQRIAFRETQTIYIENPLKSCDFSGFYGPSDRIRTCGILLPKQARYQLRYTRIRETLYRISREKAIEISLGFAFWDGGWYNGRKRRDDAWKRRVSFARRS